MKLLYFSYLIKVTDFKKLNSLADFVSKEKNQSKTKTFQNMLRDFWKYNTAFLDYFFFEFYNKNEEEKKAYASTWYMYKFQKRMNDSDSIPYFKDKAKFYRKFNTHVAHSHFLPKGKTANELKTWLEKYKPLYIIAKNAQGQVGMGIEKFSVSHEGDLWTIDDKSLESFLTYAKTKDLDLIEIFIQQHDFLQQIAPSALSTIRIITVLDKNKKVHIVGAILRMSTGKAIDNFDAGGVSAAIDPLTGTITGKVQYKDPRETQNSEVHPISNAQVTGLKIPQWEGILNLTKNAALVVPEVRTVGWDVVLTNQGPSLLEGNHNWDKTLWQKPYGKGLKPSIDFLNT